MTQSWLSRSFVVVVGTSAVAAAQSTTLVGLKSDGTQMVFGSAALAISGDGDSLLFFTSGGNVVPGDTNGLPDVFLRDRQSGAVEWISIGPGGAGGNGPAAVAGDLSSDGNFALFEGSASNWVAVDTNGLYDVFLRDRANGTTELVSLANNGTQSNGFCGGGSVSDDGRFVAFDSDATNLVAGDLNGAVDVFVRDRATATTVRVSEALAGGDANGHSSYSQISADGRFVTWASYASDLVSVDANGAGQDVFLRDLLGNPTELLSLDAAGQQFPFGSVAPRISANGQQIAFQRASGANAPHGIFLRERSTNTTECISVDAGSACAISNSSSISADGRFVVFSSQHPSLVPGDSNALQDVFVRDRVRGTTRRVSVSSQDVEAEWDHSQSGFVSNDGRFVLFTSRASNLVPVDSNLSTQDAFLRDQLRTWYLDLDGDGYGQDAITVLDVSPVAGHSALGNDCNDGDPAINPSAVEILGSSIDEDCDSWVDEGVNYCTAATTSDGCVPHMNSSGEPRLAAGIPFVLRADQLENAGVTGLMYYGLAATSVPYNLVSIRCVAGPVQRTGIATSTGPGLCNGSLALDFSAYVASHPGCLGQPFSAGQAVFAQCWFRDGGLDKLSDAYHFVMLP